MAWRRGRNACRNRQHVCCDASRAPPGRLRTRPPLSCLPRGPDLRAGAGARGNCAILWLAKSGPDAVLHLAPAPCDGPCRRRMALRIADQRHDSHGHSSRLYLGGHSRAVCADAAPLELQGAGWTQDLWSQNLDWNVAADIRGRGFLPCPH